MQYIMSNKYTYIASFVVGAIILTSLAYYLRVEPEEDLDKEE